MDTVYINHEDSGREARQASDRNARGSTATTSSFTSISKARYEAEKRKRGGGKIRDRLKGKGCRTNASKEFRSSFPICR